MTSSTVESSAEGHRHHGHVRIDLLARVLLLLAAADLAFVVGVFLYLGSFDVPWLGLLVYNLLPPVALAALVLSTAGWWPRGMPVTAAASVLLSALLVAAMLDMNSSSTGSLLLLFLPVYFCVLVLPFAALGVFVHWLRGRKIPDHQSSGIPSSGGQGAR